MGKPDADKLNFQTKEEYDSFIVTIDKKDRYYVLFEILFWTGMREGELLALTQKDVDFDNNQINITKTYYRTNKMDVITAPKTEQSVRTIDIPEFLKNEIRDYVNRLYKYPDDERIFPVVAEPVQHKMKNHIEKAGVKKIRVHDLRHSHVVYLIHQGVEPLMIKERLGHKDIKSRSIHMDICIQMNRKNSQKCLTQKNEKILWYLYIKKYFGITVFFVVKLQKT